jgi:hypothetical protein
VLLVNTQGKAGGAVERDFRDRMDADAGFKPMLEVLSRWEERLTPVGL